MGCRCGENKEPARSRAAQGGDLSPAARQRRKGSGQPAPSGGHDRAGRRMHRPASPSGGDGTADQPLEDERR